MAQQTITLSIIAMAMVTIATRTAPFILFGKSEISPPARLWLKYIPVSVLSAILAPELFFPKGRWDLSFHNLYLWAALLAFAVGFSSRNLFVTIVTAMGGLVLLRAL